MILQLVGRTDRGCLGNVPTPDREGLTPVTDDFGGTIRIIWAPRPYRLVLGMGGDDAAVVTDKHTTVRASDAFTVTEVRAGLYTASSSGQVEFDVRKNGVSILSTTLTVDQGEKTSLTAAIPAVIATTAVADDDELTAHVLDGGVGAKGAVVIIKGTYP